MKFIYPAVFRQTENGGYKAWFPDLECCEASGETLEDAIENANEAARTWITVELRRTIRFCPMSQTTRTSRQRRATSSEIFL